MIVINQTRFLTFLREANHAGGFTNDDVVAVIMPLLEEVHSFHLSGKVAPLDDISSLLITNEKLDIDENLISSPKNNLSRIKAITPDTGTTFEISGHLKESTDIGEYSSVKVNNRLVQTEADSEITMPVYLTNYRSYEIESGHHDAVTDIFVLGLILASLSLGLDFSEEEDLTSFADNRESMIFLNNNIHPSIANIIVGMTELDRKKRWKDLGEIIDNLKNYRDYNPETEHDLAAIATAKNNQKLNRQQYIQAKLRNRLFDFSRRNRLLYFKPNLKFLNLSVSSVPSVLNYKNIDPESLFYWNGDVSEKVSKGKDISLSKYIRFEDNAYIAPTLDRIRLEANKDVNEYGFSQLKLVVGFLNWYNIKEQSTEKISSPLVLVPVNIVKKKGIKDQFILEIVDTEAEINPVLSFMLRDLYDIKLPETIQLSEMSLEKLYTDIKTQVEKARSGIVVEYNNKPKIKLIHAQARQTLSQYKRRVNKTRKTHSFHNLDYSYSSESFQPLGLQLFRNYVKPEFSSLEFLINKDIKPAANHFTDPNLTETTRELYQLDEGAANPFKWEFDTCNIVLGNFNYKKMSLVRDYNKIIEEEIRSEVFDSLFTDKPKTLSQQQIDDPGVKEQYNVVQADPTQNRSVIYARKGDSYIIQGPPGTGKSQTITNLVADFVARGKKVLFVCEKRAAIDVVYYRLKQQGLDQLCCLIHDSQTDKKDFIMNLKSTFEQFTKKSLSVNTCRQQRSEVVAKISEELHFIHLFHEGMQHRTEEAGVMIRELIEILVSAGDKLNGQIEKLADGLKGYSEWINYGESIEKLSSVLKEVSGDPHFANHPFRHLNERVAAKDKAAFELKEELSKISELVNEISERLELSDVPDGQLNDLTQLRNFLSDITHILPFKEKRKTDLLNEGSDLRRQFSDAVQKLKALQRSVDEAAAKNSAWKNKFSETDTENALSIISKNEKSFFSFLNSSYRKVKNSVREAYDFSKHQVKPTYTQVVENLKQEYALRNELQKNREDQEQHFELGDVLALQDRILELAVKMKNEATRFALDENTDVNVLRELAELNVLVQKLTISLNENLRDISGKGLKDIDVLLQDLLGRAKDISAIGPIVKDLNAAHSSVKQLISRHSVTPVQVKALLAKASLENFFHTRRDVRKVEGETIMHHIWRIKKLYKELLRLNADYIVACQQERLNKLIKVSEMSIAGKSNAEKEEKKQLVEGRKILENEFGKSMRYKSIRDLATSESGQIIRELKPVWLMSPLSVSDTLPLETDYFDVVIFDEASQITLEEGIPPLYRASQAIIVGDEMQMPPSNYFSSNAADPDDLWVNEEDEGSLFALDADSFLTQGARKFPSVMLGWHYRSRHESLIAFSNASFYRNELLTIPDAQDNQLEFQEIIAHKKEDAVDFAKKILRQPITYHLLKHGVYDSRSNIAEAEYIAELIRTLLSEKNGQSIGVVAFSMEQQGEIENAVQKLCASDKEFEKIMEEEYKRIEDNQFVGIFFKNLENVQGDERDIIIMSTCYGYDPHGKMIMNFGPINRRGGEKRLNVIFSRAKKHMCVVSSIKYTDIKNEYNEGANFFRKYLQYAELAGKGNMEMANLVLRSVISHDENSNGHLQQSAIIDQISSDLRQKGFIIKNFIGQSHFKCHIAIKKSANEDHYMAGILVDDLLHYSNNDLLEQYIFKPEILRNSGWKILQVFSKDWYEDRGKILKKILSFINGEVAEPEPAPESTAVIAHTEILPATEVPMEQSPTDSNCVRLICTSDNSNKFWEIKTEDQHLVITYGKVDTKGQKIIKSYESASQAEAEKARLIKQKISKGYEIRQTT